EDRDAESQRLLRRPSPGRSRKRPPGSRGAEKKEVKAFRFADAPLKPGDANTFSGRVNTTRLAGDDAGTPVHVYRVEFEPGGRTNWHIHSGPQWIFVIEGQIRAQLWGGDPIDLETGDAVVFAAGEKHWHGAAPDSRGAHLAVNVNRTTTCLEPVTACRARQRFLRRTNCRFRPAPFVDIANDPPAGTAWDSDTS